MLGLTVIALLAAVPQLGPSTRVELPDGGTQALADALFIHISDQLWTLDAGAIDLDGIRVDLGEHHDTIDREPRSFHTLILRGAALIDSPIDGEPIPLRDTERARRTLLAWTGPHGLTIEPEARTTGANVIDALHFAADAGVGPLALALMLRPMPKPLVAELERALDAHIAEAGACFGSATSIELRFVIGAKGHVQQVRVITPVGIDEKCVLEIAKRWELPKPPGGGVILAKRRFTFAPERNAPK